MSAGILTAFARFIIFVIVGRFATSAIALVAAANVALALVGRTIAVQKAPPRLLETGTALLFCALAIPS